MAVPPPDAPPPRSWYYPTGWGCLFWLFVFLVMYVLIGIMFSARWAWYPWWW